MDERLGRFADHLPWSKRSCLSSSLMLTLLLFSIGCELPGKPTPKDKAVPDEDQSTFSAIFDTNCIGCHGKAGKLGPAPPLADPLFLALATKEHLRDVIAKGRKDSLMPAFATSSGGTLSDKQIDILVAGFSSLEKPEKPPTDPFPKLDDKPEGEATRGLAVFSRACAGCHGNQGQGGEFKSRLIGAIHEPSVLQLMTDQLLRRYIITGRDDLGMPGYAGQAGRAADFKPLTDDEINDLVALLASWRTPSEPSE